MCEAPSLHWFSLRSQEIAWERGSCCPCLLSCACFVTDIPVSDRFLPWDRLLGVGNGPGRQDRTQLWEAASRAAVQGPWPRGCWPCGNCILIEATPLVPGAVGAQAIVCFIPSSTHLLGGGP